MPRCSFSGRVGSGSYNGSNIRILGGASRMAGSNVATVVFSFPFATESCIRRRRFRSTIGILRITVKKTKASVTLCA